MNDQQAAQQFKNDIVSANMSATMNPTVKVDEGSLAAWQTEQNAKLEMAKLGAQENFELKLAALKQNAKNATTTSKNASSTGSTGYNVPYTTLLQMDQNKSNMKQLGMSPQRFAYKVALNTVNNLTHNTQRPVAFRAAMARPITIGGITTTPQQIINSYN